MKYIIINSIIFSLIFIFGCTFQMATPPTRLMKFESPGTLKKREKKAGLEFGQSFKTNSESFGPDGTYISGSFAHGLKEISQLSYNMATIDFAEDKKVYPRPYYYSFDLDYKKSFEGLQKIFAINFGGGFGISNYGQVYSSHIGYAIGYENKYITPFFNNQFHINIPSHEREVLFKDTKKKMDILNSIPSSEKIIYIEEKKRPTNTIIIDINYGLKLLIKNKVYLMGAIGHSYIRSKTDNFNLSGFSIGIEYKF